MRVAPTRIATFTPRPPRAVTACARPRPAARSSNSETYSDGTVKKGSHAGSPMISEPCESAINAQIRRENQNSMAYMSLSCRYANICVSLYGFSAFFRRASDEERQHATLLMDYLNKRGGTVSSCSVGGDHSGKGERRTPPSFPDPLGRMKVRDPQRREGFEEAIFVDAMESFESAYTLEMENLHALTQLQRLADTEKDVSLSDFVTESLIREQVDAVYEMHKLLFRLHRAGPGLGLYFFDDALL